jgi:hypothetical protein
MGPPFLRSYPKDSCAILPSECRALGEGAITTYFKHLRFDAVGPSGARTHDLQFAKREHYHYSNVLLQNFSRLNPIAFDLIEIGNENLAELM